MWLKVVAEDPDFGTSGEVEFTVDNGPFFINKNTGELTTSVRLDYETQRRHDVTVQVCMPPTQPSTHSV